MDATQKWENDLCSSPRQTIQYHSNQSPNPTSNTKEAEAEWFYEDQKDLLELTPKEDVLFIIRDWNAKVRNQEIPGVTSKFGLQVQNEAGQRLTEFYQENALVIAKILFKEHKTLHMDITRWLILNSDSFAAKDGEALYSQQKQDQELTVAHIMNSLLSNSDLNWRK